MSRVQTLIAMLLSSLAYVALTLGAWLVLTALLLLVLVPTFGQEFHLCLLAEV